MGRIIRWTVVGLVVAALAAGAGLWLRPRAAPGRLAGATVAGSLAVGGPFTLTDDTGHAVTQASWPGRWLLVYFGYTFCPDVCPTELQTIANALDALGPLADRVQPLFITIDPGRDTPAHMAEYVKMFSPRLIGLTGTAQQIAAVAHAYRVYYAKVTPKDSTTDLMNHSSFIYLMAPDGKLSTLFDPGTKAQDIAKAMRAHLSAAS